MQPGRAVKQLFKKILKPIVERFPIIARTYRAYRDSLPLKAAPVVTPFGFKFVGNPDMQSGTFEPDETRIVTHLLSKVENVINVGANIGYYCCHALHHKKHVVAFEPMELNLKYLLRNIKANGWDKQVEVFSLALSNHVGIIEIYGGGTGASLLRGWAGAADNHVTLVPCSTLDRVLGNRFQGTQTLIIVDVEGAEQWMLEGAAGYLGASPKPIWLVEISAAEHQPAGVSMNPNLLSTFQLFWDKGYESCTADAQLRPVERAEIEAIVSSGTDTLKTHNFLFYPRGERENWLS